MYRVIDILNTKLYNNKSVKSATFKLQELHMYDVYIKNEKNGSSFFTSATALVGLVEQGNIFGAIIFECDGVAYIHLEVISDAIWSLSDYIEDIELKSSISRTSQVYVAFHGCCPLTKYSSCILADFYVVNPFDLHSLDNDTNNKLFGNTVQFIGSSLLRLFRILLSDAEHKAKIDAIKKRGYVLLDCCGSLKLKVTLHPDFCKRVSKINLLMSEG